MIRELTFDMRSYRYSYFGGNLLLEGLAEVSHEGIDRCSQHGRRLFWYLVAASIQGNRGVLLEKKPRPYQRAYLIAVMLNPIGVLLYWRIGEAQDIDMNCITFRTSLFIGLSQALAIIQSFTFGITMTMDY